MAALHSFICCYSTYIFINAVLSLAGRRWLGGGGAGGSGAGSDGLHGHDDLCEESKQPLKL